MNFMALPVASHSWTVENKSNYPEK